MQEFCTAFDGPKKIGAGSRAQVALQVQGLQVLIFDDLTGEQIELDCRQPAVAPEVELRRPGRPKLGVIPREVTLLPKHWAWLGAQPGGASVALRKLVEQGMKDNTDRDQTRRAQEAAYRFMTAMAGNEPGFEEAIRALFAGRKEQFQAMTAAWPTDIRIYASELAAPAFGDRS